MPVVLDRTGSGVGAALIVICFTLGASAQPSAKQKAAAESLFQEAKTLFDEGRYEQACAKFAASQELDAGFGTLMNLGECYERRGMTASAWATFKEAAGLARSTGQADREAVARERAASLERGLAKLILRVPEPARAVAGLEVRLNGTVLPRGVWGSAVPVDPGRQHIQITADGYEPWNTELDVPQGPGQTPLDVPPLVRREAAKSGEPTASAASPTPVPVAADPLPSSDDRTQRTVGYALAGAGAVGLVVGSVLGLSAISKNKDSDPLCRTERFCTAEGLALRNDAKDAAAASTIAFVAGGAFAAGGLALVLTASGSSGPNTAANRRPTPGTLKLGSAVGLGAARLVMEGSW